MDGVKRFGYSAAFSSAHQSVLSQAPGLGSLRTSLKPSQLAYLDIAKEYFEEITRGLDSILNPGKEGYYFVEDLPDILRMLGGTGRPSREEVDAMKRRAGWIMRSLDTLAADPDKLYENPRDASELAKILGTLRSFYSDICQPLVCLGTPLPSPEVTPSD